MKPNNPQAFPLHEDLTTAKDMDQRGVTLRDYFAAKALEGLMDRSIILRVQLEDTAKKVYEMADAMLKAREK